MNDTFGDSQVVVYSSGEYSESLGECTTPDVSGAEGSGSANRKRLRELEMERRKEKRRKQKAVEALRKRKQQRKLMRGVQCQGCGACMMQ